MSQTEVQLIKADAVQTGDIANSAVTFTEENFEIFVSTINQKID